MSEVILLSRSSHKDFSKCPRLGYYNWRYKGKGLDTKTPNWHLALGLAVHKGMELVFSEPAGISPSQGAMEEFKRLYPPLGLEFDEGLALAHALVEGWIRTRYEAFLQEHEVLLVEKEIRSEIATGVVLQSRADLVTRERFGGRVWVWNWKTTGVKKDWTQKWEHDIQAWTEALAVENLLNEPVAGVIYEGFFKGTKREGSMTCPLIYGYQDKLSGTWFPERTNGAKKTPVWNEPGISTWLGWMGEEKLGEFFIRSNPIFKDNDLVLHWLEEVAFKEVNAKHILESGSEKERLRFFWRNFSEINCKFCTYRKACKDQQTVEGLLSVGVLKEREDHHGKVDGEGEGE